jgi:hypothetical protein
LKEYINDDYSNTDIHDTHLKSTDDDYYFPNDFNNANANATNITADTIKNIFSQIKDISRASAEILSNKVKTYDNVQNGFYIFGIDLMIEINQTPETHTDKHTNIYKVILLEINEKSGYKTKTPNGRHKLDSLLFNWINNTILKPIFNTHTHTHTLLANSGTGLGNTLLANSGTGLTNSGTGLTNTPNKLLVFRKEEKYNNT